LRDGLAREQQPEVAVGTEERDVGVQRPQYNSGAFAGLFMRS
jgi:hypothetical protein